MKYLLTINNKFLMFFISLKNYINFSFLIFMCNHSYFITIPKNIISLIYNNYILIEIGTYFRF